MLSLSTSDHFCGCQLQVNCSAAGYVTVMSTPSDEAHVTRRLTEDASGAEAARRQWLAGVTADPRLTDGHRVAAEILARTDRAPDEHIAAADELAQWGYLTANEDGSYAANLPPGP